MILNRRSLTTLMLQAPLAAIPLRCAEAAPAQDIVTAWYKLVLELVRHTATYSPPVASRAFAYLGVAAHEAVTSGLPALRTLANQLNGLKPLPARASGETYDEAAVLHAAMAQSAHNFFANTGPTGQRAIKALEAKLQASVSAGLAEDIVRRSEDYGRAVASHIFDWSQSDGGAVITNMGFPLTYELTKGPAHWVPTSTIAVQQTPLLPGWAKNRPFAMPNGDSCLLPPPPDYSEDPQSEFYRQAMEVCEARRKLTDEQRIIARFWSDDPMLSPTPPGHWLSIALQILERDSVPLDRSVDVLAKLGIAVADAFIACWRVKFEYDLVRPVTYIKRVIDPKWEPLLITPPFPEYPSGHSTQSGAAAVVLTALFGENFAFEDNTHGRDNIAARQFPDFWAAAQEAAISRLYGGIHFRAACERGLDQGRCVGAFAVALKTRA